jgi:hypothetical protein
VVAIGSGLTLAQAASEAAAPLKAAARRTLASLVIGHPFALLGPSLAVRR